MFNVGDTIRNNKCLDIDLYIINILKKTDKYFALNVWYITQRNPELIIENDEIKIKTEDFYKWNVVKKRNI